MNDHSSVDADTGTPEIDRSLREFQEHFDELVSHIDEIIWMADADADEILYVSPAFEHVYGHPVRGLVEASGLWRDAVLPADRPALERLFEVLRSGEKDRFESEYRIRRPDGQVRRLSTRGSVVRDDDGKARHIVGITRDITERWTAERQYELLVEAIPDLVGRTDGEGRYLYANGPLVEALGATSPDEVVGRTHRELGMREDLAAKWDEAIETAFEEGVPAEVMVELRYRGELRWFSATVVPERGQDGQVETVLGVARDVTERVETERTLKEGQRRLLRAQEVAGVGDWSWDVAEDRVNWSPKLYDLWGIDADEGPMTFERILEVVHPDDRDRFDEVVQRALEGGTYATFEHRIVRADGEIQWMESRGEVDRGADGQVVKLTGTSQDITERQEAGLRLERAQQLARVGDWEMDLRSGEWVWSEALFDILGRDPAEGPGTFERFIAQVHPDDRPKIEPFMEDPREVLGEPYDMTIRFRRDDGQMRWIHARLFAEAGPGGEPVRLVGTAQDVTERVQVQTEVERERDLRAALFDKNVDPIMAVEFDADGDAVIRSANPRFREMFGFTGEIVAGRLVREVLVPEGGMAEHEEFVRRLAGGEPVRGEVWRVTAEGPRLFRLQAIPIELEDGDPGGYAWYTDLTELRALEEDEAFKARLLDEVGQAVIATDAAGRVTYWNDHAAEMYGWTAEEALGQGIMELTVPDSEAGRVKAEEILAALSDGAVWQGEFTVVRKDGSTFPAWVSDAPVNDDAGNLVGVIGISYDLTGEKEMQQRLVRTTNQLRSRNRELQQLSQATAHEFQSPIRDIVRYLQLLEEQLDDRLTEEDRQHLGFAVGGARRIHELVLAIQEYLDAATRPADPGPCDAGQVLGDVLAEMGLSGDGDAGGDPLEGMAEATVTWDEDLPLVGIGERSMKPILKHLLDNAVAYRGEKPARVHVGLERQGEVWVLSVRDEGIGVDPRHHERIFRPFRTLHGPHEGGGPGLGLSLCRGIVEAHGGSMWVRSEAGEGATFYATLPPVDAVLPLPASEVDAGEVVPGSGDDAGEGARTGPLAGDDDTATPDLWEE